MAQAFRKFMPLFDRILIQKAVKETTTKGGIMIPEKAQGKVLEGVVMATGQGGRAENGTVVPVSVKVGDKVLLPEFGGTKVLIDEDEFFLYRDGDMLGKFESS